MAKLVYHHYGMAVHQALGNPEALNLLAPQLFGWSRKPGINASVYVMEYLYPPGYETEGWCTLAEVNQDKVAKIRHLIYPVLQEIVNRLVNLGFVHGDLRPNNLMIRMKDRTNIAEPVEIKVVDFEWADKVGIARYPHNRNEDIGFPGKAGDLIGPKDDQYMIDKWKEDINKYVESALAQDGHHVTWP